MNKKGFSLIELLLVIAIIGIFGVLSFNFLSQSNTDTRLNSEITKLKQIILKYGKLSQINHEPYLITFNDIDNSSSMKIYKLKNDNYKRFVADDCSTIDINNNNTYEIVSEEYNLFKNLKILGCSNDDTSNICFNSNSELVNITDVAIVDFTTFIEDDVNCINFKTNNKVTSFNVFKLGTLK